MARYASRIYRLVSGIVRSEADVEEVVRDVFVTLVREHDTLAGCSAVGSWIYRIAVNIALKTRRGRRLDLEVAIDEFLPAFTADGRRDGESAFMLADWSENPEAELLSDEARAVLSHGLERLPDHYRAVLVMRDVDGLTQPA